MNLIIFEDHRSEGFYPITISHPVFDLHCGCFNALERFKRLFRPVSITLVCREFLAEIARERHGLPVNDFAQLEGDCLLINAATKPTREIRRRLLQLEEGSSIYCDDILIGAIFSAEKIKTITAQKFITGDFSFVDTGQREDVSDSLFGHLWDLVNANGEMITADIELIIDTADWKTIANKKESDNEVYIHPEASVQAGSFLDFSRGPIVIDEQATVEPRSLIQGPAYIGKGSTVMGGIIREGCSLGPVCKVGGELEESIILGYSNKCHEGFIGHAYLGEWVNLGALTTNSDLKNNYSPITVHLQGRDIATGSVKAGSFIGDHTKTGIGTLFNTGIVIGFCCNLYGGMLFEDKEIGHFKWGKPGSLTDYRVDKAIEVARAVTARRGVQFTEAAADLFRKISFLK